MIDDYEVTYGSGEYVALLVGGSAATQKRVTRALADGFELFHASDPELALKAARRCAPDIILLDVEPLEAKRVRRSLRADPLTGPLPLLDLTEARPDETAEALAHRVLRAISGSGAAPFIGGAGLTSLDAVLELVDREVTDLAHARLGRKAAGVSVEGEREEALLAAIRQFASRLVELCADESADERVSSPGLGRVDVVTFPEELEAVGSGGRESRPDETVEIHDDDVVSESLAWLERLDGVRAVVADDDDTVREAFATTLSEHGAEVIPVANGREALEAVRRDSPDVLLTDILMPEIDGWELLRTIRREVLLWDIPAVVLSWREDFLQRMAELRAGANEYILKESTRSRILDSTQSVIAGRRQVEARLHLSTEVAGRVEVMGIVPLLRLLVSHGSDLHLTIRETWNLFHVDLLDGRIAHVTNATVGGHHTEGLTALTTLLGVKRGRFSVRAAQAKVRPALDEEIEPLLAYAALPLQALLDSVSGGAILELDRVQLKDQVLEDYLEVAPLEVRGIIKHLATGGTARELLLHGRISPRELEWILTDMIRRGVVETVEKHPLAPA